MKKIKIRKIAQNFCRGFFFRRYQRSLGFVSDEINGNIFTYDFNTDIGRLLYFDGEFEKREIEICGEYIKRDSVVLDIGANIGVHSIYFSKMAIDGTVIAIEPSPETFSLLLKNVQKYGNIFPLNVGLSCSNDLKNFFVTADNAYSGLKDTHRKEIKKIVKVFCFRLDDLLMNHNFKKIDFVKIDVEGVEQDVIEGMERIIEEYRPVIFSEIYRGENSNLDPRKTINHLISKGYRASVFDGKKLINYKEHDDRYYNYLFVPR